MVAPNTATAEQTVHQPYECSVCHSRFTRHENLKRHSALHSTSRAGNPIQCKLCSSTFSRQDLQQRHMKRKHPEAEDNRQTSSRHDQTVLKKPRRHVIDVDDDSSNLSRTWKITSSDEPEQATSGCAEKGDQMEFGSTRSQNDASSETASKSSIQDDNDDDPLVVHERTNIQQPWLSDTRFIDHFVEGTNNGETTPCDNAATSRRNVSDGSLRSPVLTGHYSAYFSASSNVIASPQTHTSDLSSPNDLSPNALRFRDEWFPLPNQILRGLELYFRQVSHFVPFIHGATVSDVATIPPVLVLGILSIAYQYGEDPMYHDEPGSGKALALHCFHRARALLYLEDETPANIQHSLIQVQAYLLIEICAVMYLCGNESAYGIRAHSKMIALARSSGVLQPKAAASGATDNLDSMWQEFVNDESQKRTAYAVHQFDAMLYQFLSIPRSLSHLEMKHDLPCPSELWYAATSAEWAHKKLRSGTSSPSISYVEAVRLLLAPEPKVNALPVFDPYGAVNIAQFLISSAREISGWSVMTGRVSMERFEPLRSSLEALGPLVRSQAGHANSPGATASEATWEIAMIELQMWSPSHTGGVVGGSVDTILREWTSICLGPWSETLFSASKAVQPHVDWYLRYLDATMAVNYEPPWITLYAYKAYLVAWQLLRGGVIDAIQAVGVSDGSRIDAIAWANSVFGRRKNLKIGELILKSLDMLANLDGVG